MSLSEGWWRLILISYVIDVRICIVDNRERTLAITILVHSRIYHVDLGLRVCLAKARIVGVVALAQELVSLRSGDGEGQ